MLCVYADTHVIYDAFRFLGFQGPPISTNLQVACVAFRCAAAMASVLDAGVGCHHRETTAGMFHYRHWRHHLPTDFWPLVTLTYCTGYFRMACEV